MHWMTLVTFVWRRVTFPSIRTDWVKQTDNTMTLFFQALSKSQCIGETEKNLIDILQMSRNPLGNHEFQIVNQTFIRNMTKAPRERVFT